MWATYVTGVSAVKKRESVPFPGNSRDILLVKGLWCHFARISSGSTLSDRVTGLMPNLSLDFQEVSPKNRMGFSYKLILYSYVIYSKFSNKTTTKIIICLLVLRNHRTKRWHPRPNLRLIDSLTDVEVNSVLLLEFNLKHTVWKTYWNEVWSLFKGYSSILSMISPQSSKASLLSLQAGWILSETKQTSSGEFNIINRIISHIRHFLSD